MGMTETSKTLANGMTIPERNVEHELRRRQLRDSDRKDLLAQFSAYWPEHAIKGVSRYELSNAILQAEFDPTAPLGRTGSKATATWR